jgi:REP element-mobilizing transposase RayT
VEADLDLPRECLWHSAAGASVGQVHHWERASPDAHGGEAADGRMPRHSRQNLATRCGDIRAMDDERLHKLWHRRGYLPHFDQGAVVQAVTFRLADSLPRAFYERLSSRTPAERGRSIEAYIDRSRGSCVLVEAPCAKIVESVLTHFDGARYRLLAWVIMPNHVHSILEQMPGHRLGDIVRSWKNYSARRINSLRDRHGAVWAPDYFDRFIRNEDHLANAIHYVEDNPVKAGLVSSPDKWPFSSFAARRDRSAALPPCASGDARSQ